MRIRLRLGFEPHQQRMGGVLWWHRPVIVETLSIPSLRQKEAGREDVEWGKGISCRGSANAACRLESFMRAGWGYEGRGESRLVMTRKSESPWRSERKRDCHLNTRVPFTRHRHWARRRRCLSLSLSVCLSLSLGMSSCGCAFVCLDLPHVVCLPIWPFASWPGSNIFYHTPGCWFCAFNQVGSVVA